MRIACVLLLLATQRAYAEDIDDNAWYPRVSAGVGIGYRGGTLADLTTSGGAVTSIVEVKLLPAVFIGPTLDFSPGTARDDMGEHEVKIATRAVGIRVGTALMSFGAKPTEIGGGMVVSGGLAREWIAWDGGGLARNVLELGVGTTLNLPRSGDTYRQFRFGFRMLFARAPEPAKRPAGCDGPCDTATGAPPYDVGFVLEVTCHLGR